MYISMCAIPALDLIRCAHIERESATCVKDGNDFFAHHSALTERRKEQNITFESLYVQNVKGNNALLFYFSCFIFLFFFFCMIIHLKKYMLCV